MLIYKILFRYIKEFNLKHNTKIRLVYKQAALFQELVKLNRLCTDNLLSYIYPIIDNSCIRKLNALTSQDNDIIIYRDINWIIKNILKYDIIRIVPLTKLTVNLMKSYFDWSNQTSFCHLIYYDEIYQSCMESDISIFKLSNQYNTIINEKLLT